MAGCESTESASTGQTEESQEAEQKHTYTNTDFAMGTVISQTIYSIGEDKTTDYVSLLEEIEDNLISWRVEGSEIDQINQSAGTKEGIQVSDKTAGYLAQTLLLAQKSGGKLDPTIGKLSRLWNIDGEDATEEIPDQEEIDRLLSETGYEQVVQDQNQIVLPEDVSLDFGSVGKGIGCDEIYNELKADPDVSGAVISVGGSIVTYGQKDDGSDWSVAIAGPRSEEGDYLGILSVSGDKFVSTSGDYEKYFIKDGKRYHHILDPDTGYPAESGLISTTVLCDSGLLSDGLSTACFVLGAEKALDLLEEYGAEGILVDEEKNIYLTDGIAEQFTLLDDEYQIVEK
jgi:thiamine biosynthesis lipoprotein